MELEPGVMLEPFLYLLSVVNAHIVTDDVDEGNERWGMSVYVLKERDELYLPLAREALTDGVAGSGVKCCKKIEGSSPLVFMLNQVGLVSLSCSFGGGDPRPWLKRCFLIYREDDLMRKKGTGVDLDDLANAAVEGLIPFVLGRKPHVVSPGLELMAGDNATNRLRADALDDAIFFELPR